MRIHLILCCGLLSLLQACSGETAKRTVYDTMQNVGRQQCRQDPTADCPPGQSYEEYRKQRQEETRPQQP